MNSSAISLLVGAFVGTYLNNPKFKVQIDKGFQGIMGQGIDALNKLGGEPDVVQPNPGNESD